MFDNSTYAITTYFYSLYLHTYDWPIFLDLDFSNVTELKYLRIFVLPYLSKIFKFDAKCMCTFQLKSSLHKDY